MIPLPLDLPNDPAVTWTEDMLRFADTDRNGHINNGALAALAESARMQLFDGLFAPQLPPRAFFIVARLSVEFHAELYFPGRVRTAVWISRLGVTSLIVHQALLRDDALTPEPVATCEAVCVLLDALARRPLALPDATRAVAMTLIPVATSEASVRRKGPT